MSPNAKSSEPIDQINRRSLPKSRTGCSVCKLRKVKCDEERPFCRNCRKRGARCAFGPSTLRTNISSNESALAPLTPSSLHQPSPCLPLDNYGANGFTVADMQLLHHYTTSTCLTFSADPVVRDLWRNHVPQVGFASSYVLHGALSLAALHLAHFRPKHCEPYLIQAAAHYDTAAALALPLYSSVSSDNVIPLYLFSILTTYYAFARPKHSEEFLFSHSGAIPDWLFLCRGIRPVVESEAFDLNESPIAIMFQLGGEMHAIWDANALESEPLLMLESSIRAHVEHSHTLDVLLEAVDSLKRAFAIVTVAQYTEEIQSMCVFAWLYKMSEDYLCLVKDENPEALCVLGFFCVLLHRLDRHWWIQGQSSHLMDRIYSLLDHKHRAWLRWPTGEMGWVPTS